MKRALIEVNMNLDYIDYDKEDIDIDDDNYNQ